jgi:phospholipid-binding lipoprotein MlaA
MNAIGPGQLRASAPNKIKTRVAGVLLGIAVLTGCATTGRETVPDSGPEASPAAGTAPAPAPTVDKSADDGSRDPLEGFNRAMYRFNEKLDDYVLKPAAEGYRAVLPSPVRTGVANFFSNLHDPVIIVSDLLQGKLVQALSDTGRFMANTIIGIYGLFDPATPLGLPKHNEDFGQTLGVWGVGEGPYIVWPFLGPSTLRDSGGSIFDWQIYPPYQLESVDTRNTLIVIEAVDTREKLLDTTDILEQAAGQDPYVFVREAYRQHRKSLVYDGNPPREVPEGLFDDEPAPQSPARP